jgi:dienelactone hydrolase
MKLVRLLAAACLLLAFAPAHADGPRDSRSAYLKLLERPRVAPRPELAEMPAVAGLRKYHLWFYSEATERVPGYMLLPDAAQFKGRRPVVIALHPTSGNKDNGQIADLVLKSARAGFIGVAIDGRFHGERTRAGEGAEEYNQAILQAFRSGQGHPLFYDTTWDVMRLIDYLATRKDVDASRIGLTGISKGGIETWLTAAAESRVAAAVPYIGVQGFKWGLDNGQWRARVLTFETAFETAAKDSNQSPRRVEFAREFYARVLPGIDGQFDAPAMLPLIAPRPLMVVNADSDANTPIAGVRLAVGSAKAAYDASGAADKLQFVIEENTGHRVNPEAIDAGIAWFTRWLKP